MRFILHISAVILSAFFLSQICSAEEDSALLPTGADETLVDGSYYTFAATSPEEPLELVFEEKISSFYIVFNTVPSPYRVITEYGADLYGENGFMHQYVEFDAPTDVVKIAVQESIEICDVYGFCGEAPEWVQRWEEPCDKADILLLAAHADDEHLMFGGTLPYYAGELDLAVQVAYLTSHWNEQPRPHELLDGLWTVGVENYPIIGIVDDIPCWSYKQAQSVFDEEAIIEWETGLIRRFCPSVIITHDTQGEYGHGAHMMAAYSIIEAVERAADKLTFTESAEEYGVWNTPKLYLHFWKENAIEMDWEIALESFGGITAREAAALGYDCHKSQHIWGYSVNYGEYWDCRQFGLYRSLVGEDTEADFMDNITPYAEITTTEAPPETTPVEIISTVSTTSAEDLPVVTTTASSEVTTVGEKEDNISMYIICAALTAVVLVVVIALVARRKR